MAKSEKGDINESIFYGICSKVCLSSRLNTDPKLYAKYQNPNSCGFLDIVLATFSHCNTIEVETGITLLFSTNFAQKLIMSSKP